MYCKKSYLLCSLVHAPLVGGCWSVECESEGIIGIVKKGLKSSGGGGGGGGGCGGGGGGGGGGGVSSKMRE
jgi:hypothetical protein